MESRLALIFDSSPSSCLYSGLVGVRLAICEISIARLVLSEVFMLVSPASEAMMSSASAFIAAEELLWPAFKEV